MPKAETIWIIGASEGIGAALARAWARRGAQLILSARSRDKLEALQAELGGNHLVVPVDVSSRADLEQAVKTIAGHAPLDRVVHLAAAYDPGRLSDADPNTAAEIVTINLTGSFHVAQLATPLLKPLGQLAMCGSVAGYFGLPKGQIYSATKAGVINLTESLAAELAGRIDVRLINPGFVDTRLTRLNSFSMPALITADTAAKEIIRGLESRRFEIHFPRRLTLSLKILRALPYWAALRLTRRLAA